MNSRPIDLNGYELDAPTMDSPYLLSLIPTDPSDIRKTWHFRCDTSVEMVKWVTMLKEAIEKASMS